MATSRSVILGCTLVVGIACSAQLGKDAQGQSSPATIDPVTVRFTGCYELKLGRWWPWGFGEENSYVTPPSRIELLSEHGTRGFEQDGFVLRTIPRQAPPSAGSRESSYWRVRSSSEVDLVWTDGFTGVTLKLQKEGDRLRGWAHPHFDAVKLIPRTARVEGKRILCATPWTLKP